MARPNPLRRLMQTPLPTITAQKRKLFRPNRREVIEIYDLINKFVFKNVLIRPPIVIGPWKGVWGSCLGSIYPTRRGTRCTIKLADKYYCLQWFVTILSHEMVHQYEWDILQKPMTHRQSFFFWKEHLEQFQIPLKSWHRCEQWFKYQNMNRC